MLTQFLSIALGSLISATVDTNAVHFQPPVVQFGDTQEHMYEPDYDQNSGWNDSDIQVHVQEDPDDNWRNNSWHARKRVVRSPIQYGRPSKRILVRDEKRRQLYRDRNIDLQHEPPRTDYREFYDQLDPAIDPQLHQPSQMGSRMTTERITRRKAQDRVQRSIDSRQRYTGTHARTQVSSPLHAMQSDDRIRGNRLATVSVIEYVDMQCPSCRAFHTVMKHVLSQYGDDVNWIMRHYPLLEHHDHALPAAQAAECVYYQDGIEAFWKYVDYIMLHGTDSDMLVSYAKNLGLDYIVLNECLMTQQTRSAILTDIEHAQQNNITSTPWVIVVNNRTGAFEVFQGVKTEQEMQSIINELLHR